MAPAALEGNPLFQGVVKESAAFRLMKRMGWEEGTGLGKEKQGIKQHLKVKSKQDTCGIGVDAQKKAESVWTFNTTAFDSILKNLKVQAAGAETKESLGEEDDTREHSSMDGQKVQKVARPQGRYKKRERGKLVRSYSQTDLNAILGTNVKNPSTSGSSEEINQHLINGVFGGDLRSLSEDGVEARTEVLISEDTQVSQDKGDWWGRKYGFVSGGRLGASKHEQKYCPRATDNEKEDAVHLRPSFSEMDQEDLYKLVQGKATTGKQGLGKGSALSKMEAAWVGRKTDLDTQSDGEVDKSERCGGGITVGNQPENSNTESRFQKSKCSKRKYGGLLAEAAKGGQVGQEDVPTRADVSSVKWKKICERILLEAPGHKLSLKRLHKRLKREVEVSSGKSISSCMDVLKLKEKIEKSSKFKANRNKVYLSLQSQVC